MRHNHRCTGDSHRGFAPGRMGMALMCSCGNWLMPGGGEWQVVPFELLPSSCQAITRMYRAARVLRNCALALAIGMVMGWWLL